MSLRDDAFTTTESAPLNFDAHVGTLRLVVIAPGGLVTTHTLPPSGQVVLGRGGNAQVQVDHTSVSRRHAILHIRAPLQIEDLGSSNGTRLRNHKLEPRTPANVSPGEPIMLGDATLIVQSATTARPRSVLGHGAFEQRLEEECARAARTGGRFGVARLHLETRADAHRVEGALGASLGPLDVLGRYGAGEYEALLPDQALEEAYLSCRRLTEELHKQGLQIRVGVAAYPADGPSPERLLERACAAVGLGMGREPPVLVVNQAMRQLLLIIDKVAQGTLSVLLLGETGVGKEVVAHEVHKRSPRASRPFVIVHCAAIPENLLESTLFGHEKGAFTGADNARAGLLESADGGTVFFDEIGEVSLSVQPKLLRALEEKAVTRVGSLKARPLDIRFVAATNRDLEAEAKAGRFRSDLYYRLSGIALVVPPLRERRDEILPLAEAFLAASSAASGLKRPPRLTAAARELLLRYSWPGNVRELRNTAERAVLLSGGESIGVDDLPREKMEGAVSSPVRMDARRPAGESAGLRDQLSSLERDRIVDALERSGGNQTEAALLLGISRRGLCNKIVAFGLPRPRKG